MIRRSRCRSTGERQGNDLLVDIDRRVDLVDLDLATSKFVNHTRGTSALVAIIGTE